MPCRIATVLCVLAFAAAAGLRAQPPDPLPACAEAARAMLGLDELPRTGAAPEVSAAGATVGWETAAGHRGTCSLDAAGRLVAVRVGGFAPVAAAGTDWVAYAVTCESRDGARRDCAIRAPSRVELERRLGEDVCVAGETWGARGATVWVDGGCRAVFRVSPVEAWPPYTVRCESEDRRRRECEIRAGGRVRLLRRESRAQCEQGRSWGYDGTVLWVDQGCRGVFEVTAGGSWGSEYDRAHDACLERARSEGLELVLEVGSSQTGRYYDFELDLERDGVLVEARCRYDRTSGELRWSNR